MQRFRNSWLALVGGAILVTLSVSAAFGSAPSASADGTRGQTIAGFVHGLLFDGGTVAAGDGSEACYLDEDAEEEDSELGASAVDVNECGAEESDCDVEEPTADAPADTFGAVLESGACDADNSGDEEKPADAADAADAADEADEAESTSDGTHGACVSEVAHDKDAVGGKNDNHGGAVSEAARTTCREDGAEEAAEPESTSEDAASKSADEAAAKEERKAEHEADKAARKVENGEARQSRGQDVHEDGDAEESEHDEDD
ncbi:MAG: hypothetical protein ABIO99_09430 [Candidatus Limnocylindria bacterium]